MFSLAVAQPLYQLIGEQPEFLVAHHFTAPGLVILAACLSLLVPLALYLVFRGCGQISATAAKACLALWVTVLCTLVLLPVFGRHLGHWLELSPSGAVILSVISAVALCVGYFKSSIFRLFLTYFSVLAIVFPVYFLFFSPASQLMKAGPSGLGGDRVTLDRNPPIVFLLFDELPVVSVLDEDMNIDAGRFPNLAELQQDALWFPLHTANANSTLISVSSLLSGHTPFGRYQGLPRLRNYPDNLFVLLGAHYDMNVHEHGSQLCPEAYCGAYEPPDVKRLMGDLWIIGLHIWLPEAWASQLPAIDNDWMNFGQRSEPVTGLGEEIASFKAGFRWSERIAAFDEFLASMDEHPDGFHYLHSMLPHAAWQYLPDGRLLTLDRSAQPSGVLPGQIEGLGKHVWTNNEEVVRVSRQRHILQTAYVDTLLGRVMDRLRAQGLYDNSLIVVTSDHGAAFMPGHSRRSLEVPLLPQSAGVPLLIKFPGSKPSGTRRYASQAIDIVPTLLAALGAEGWSDVEGVDLTEAPEIQGRPIRVFSQNSSYVETTPTQYQNALQQNVSDYTRRDGTADFQSLLTGADRLGLIGQYVQEFELEDVTKADLIWDSPELLSNNRPGAPALQLVASGQLSGGDFAGRELAISVNGVIRAVTRVFDFPGMENHIEALLPESAFTDERDNVSAWLISSHESETRLQPVVSAHQRRFELREEGGKTVLVSAGQQYTVERGVVPGWCIVRRGKAEGVWVLGGWAASLLERRPAEQLVLFVNGKFAMSGPPVRDSETVAERFEMPEILRSGFSLPLITSNLDAPQALEVRVFALSPGGQVSELNYPSNAEDWPFKPNPKPGGPAILPWD